jgi:DUF4097 and DUF4098 domain-containing protein YvlB
MSQEEAMQDSSRHVFQTPEAVDLRVELNAGRIDLFTTDTGETTIDLVPLHGDSTARELIANARVEQSGRKVSVLMPKNKGGFFGRKGQVHATIRLPHESNLRIESGSADVEGRGRYGVVHVDSGSGDVELEQIASGELRAGSGDVDIQRIIATVRVKTGSGDVKLGPVGGSVDVMAGSGDVVLDSVGEGVKAKTGSGDILLKSASGRVDALAGSGDVVIRRIDQGEIFAKTGSGDVTVGVTRGTAAYLDIQTVTGDVRSSLDSTEQPHDGDATVTINVVSGTGDVDLQRA